MIEAAKEAGADAVKFQTFKAEEFCGNPKQLFTYQSQGNRVTEPMLKMFKRYEFSRKQWYEIKEHAERVGISFFSTPQNRSDLNLLLEIGVPAIKIGSDDFTNLPLLESYALEDLPLILSCGMSDLAEVHEALETVGWFDGKPIIVLLCTSQYPTPPEDVNIRKLETLQQAFPGLMVGFSDHTQGPEAANLAVAFGAKVFEKHFTLSHDLPGPDHWFSNEPEELKTWLQTIRKAELMLGSPYLRPTSLEHEMRNIARRSVVVLRDITEDECLDHSNIGLRRPGGGLPPSMLKDIIGLRAAKTLKSGVCLRLSDFRS